MTKRELLKRYDGTAADLARELGIHASQITRWTKVPQKHLLRLKYELRPELFEKRA